MAARLLRDKMGYKAGQKVLLLDLPEGVDDPFAGVEHTLAHARTATLGQQKFDLVLAFTRDQAALAHTAEAIRGCLPDDPKLWVAYPKKSGRIPTDLTRDAGWGPLFAAGYIVVSIAAVDETWSAVRFRPRHLVKTARC